MRYEKEMFCCVLTEPFCAKCLSLPSNSCQDMFSHPPPYIPTRQPSQGLARVSRILHRSSLKLVCIAAVYSAHQAFLLVCTALASVFFPCCLSFLLALSSLHTLPLLRHTHHASAGVPPALY